MNTQTKKWLVWLNISVYGLFVFLGQGLHFVPGFDCGSSHCGAEAHHQSDVDHGETHSHSGHAHGCHHDHHHHADKLGRPSSHETRSKVDGNRDSQSLRQVGFVGVCSVCKLLTTLSCGFIIESNIAASESCVAFASPHVPSLCSETTAWFQSRAPPASC